MAYYREVIPRKPHLRQEIPYTEHLLPKEVDKFGGSSTANPHLVRPICESKIKEGQKPLIIVSAPKGMTDKLIKLSDGCFEEVKPILEERIARTGTLLNRLKSYERDAQKYEPSKKILDDAVAITSDTATVSEIASPGLSSKIYNLMFPKKEMWGLKRQIFEYLIDLDHFVEVFFHKREKEIAKQLGIDPNKVLTSGHDFKRWKQETEKIDRETSALLLEEAKRYMKDKFVLWGELPTSRIITEALRSLGYKVYNSEPSDLSILTNMLSREIEFIRDFQQKFKGKSRELAGQAYDAYVLGGYITKGVVKFDSGILGEKEIMLRTTLGRGGSDLTAVASGGALGVPVFLYSDTDGIYACDPKIYPNNSTISILSTTEGIEFAKYGSKILYVRAMEYAEEYGVNVTSLNTFNPSHRGTRILKKPNLADWLPKEVKGISFLDKGDYYTMAVIGHDIGESHIDVQKITDKLRAIHPIVNQHINTHSVTFDLPREVVQAKAQKIYNAFCS